MWKGFERGLVAIHCKTREEYMEVVKHIERNTDVKWRSGHPPTVYMAWGYGYNPEICLVCDRFGKRTFKGTLHTLSPASVKDSHEVITLFDILHDDIY